MGTVLDFAAARRPLSGRRPPVRGRGPAAEDPAGRVVLFPGVRIEREPLDLAPRIGTIGATAKNVAPEHD
ncbi:hypothetical protein [Pannonibacter tanglangensis]|uniref:Uncharacterized protein n=1 Tax=Pannonibacter tanglangensis TaxID=2750084 RepID=A0ABW9ZDK3_9HYPH|nr:hypothetical protein [Pannonibacter sp. XCT-34]NBN62914.1 hypothetical protein [Pannonibacter sp. XCT-34]